MNRPGKRVSAEKESSHGQKKNETLESLDLCAKDYPFIKHGLMLGR